MSLLSELKRRNVIRVGLAYLVGSWLLLQVIDVVGPILRLPETAARYLLFLLVIGFIPAVVLAWAFEWTPQGVRRESEAARADPARETRRLDRVIMVTLALAVALLLFDRFHASEPDALAGAESAAPDTVEPVHPAAGPLRQKSVAVLPFVPMSSGPDDDYFADGLTEEIINALGQARDLLVTARSSAFHFKGRSLPVGEIAQQLGVAHVVEGSVRRAGEQLRVSAQLVRADDGFQLWSESFDRRGGDDFSVQAEIAEKVAQALGVLLDDGLRLRMRAVGTRNVDAFVAFQKGIELYERAHQEANQISLLRQANVHFERAVELQPDLYSAYEYHTDLYTHVLLMQASGEPEGDVTETDLAAAPAALRRDFERAVRHARTPAERHNAEFGKALVLGPWRGLDLLARKTAGPAGCEVGVWQHLMGPLPGLTEPLLEAFRRMAACDPLRARPMVHMVGLLLWLGRPLEASRLAQDNLERIDHPLLARHLAFALALSGEADAAEAAVQRRVHAEDERFSALAMLAAIRGDGAAASRYQEDYLGIVGGNDRETLVLAAVRGDRVEANRLARRIDSQPFGYVVLLQSIFFCLCGPPFDLESTPVFASMLEESGLTWPPLAPYGLPLKNW